MKKYLCAVLLVSTALLSACGTQSFAPGANSTSPHTTVQQQIGGVYA